MAWAGSFVFNSERGQPEQQEGSPKKDGGESFVFNREAAAKQQQQQQETSEIKQETSPGADESPKLWRPGAAQQSEPPPPAGRTKEDLYKLYETMGSSATEMSLKDLVERPKKPVRKNSHFKPTAGRNIPDGRPAATGAGSGGRQNNNQHHHRPEFPSHTKVTVPPRANGNQTAENPRRSFGDMLHEEDPKSGGKGADNLPRSRSTHVPETSPRGGHHKTITPRTSPRIVTPETTSQPTKSPRRGTKSPRGVLVNFNSGNEAPPRSTRKSPGPSPLPSPRPRRGSKLSSGSSPSWLGSAEESWSADVPPTSSPRGGQKTWGAFPLGSTTPTRRSSVDQQQSPLAPISSPSRLGSPARLGYEREEWSIDGLLQSASSPRRGESPWATPRRSSVGVERSPLSRSSPARIGYEREPWGLEELRRAETPRRSTASPLAEHMDNSMDFDQSRARPVPAPNSNTNSKEDDKSHSSLGDFLGKQLIAARPLQDVHQTNYCSKCSSYTLMKTRCLVCGKIYCRSCVKDAMGDMPEGRKCTDTCVGRPLHDKYKNKAGTGCFWIPRSSKIVELKLMRQQASNPTTPTSIDSTSGKHSTKSRNQSPNKPRAKRSYRSNNQNMPPRMSVSSNS